MGEGPRGRNDARSTLHRISVNASTTHNQTGPLWCWFPSGWACARPRPLWASPTTSPVKLGVSLAAAATRTGIFNQRFEALFPHAGALGYTVCFAPRLSGLSVCEGGAAGCYPLLCLPRSLPLSVWPCWFICTNVGPQDLPVVRLSAPFVPHSASLGPATANASPLRPGCPSPPLLPVLMKVYFFYLLGVRLPCHSIFCQFWLCEEAQCVYLRRHLCSSPRLVL